MLTITSKEFHEKLQVDNEEIILNGPPSDMRGHIFFNNENEEQVKVKGLPIQHLTKNTFLNNGDDANLKVSLRLNSKEKKIEEVWHKVNAQTPPGTYESLLMVGGKKRKLKMIVQPCIKIDLLPANLSFQGASPGTKHKATITLVNMGNLPFQIPEVKHITTLDMDFLCRATALAIRGKGAEGYASMMDEITRNVHDNITDWISVNLKESGKVIAPGKSTLIELTFTLPKDIDPNRDYSGNLRIWDKEITYVIKSHINTPETKKNDKQ